MLLRMTFLSLCSKYKEPIPRHALFKVALITAAAGARVTAAAGARVTPAVPPWGSPLQPAVQL